MSIHYHVKSMLKWVLLLLIWSQTAEAAQRNSQFTQSTVTGESLLDYEYELIGNRKLNMCALEDKNNDYYYKDYSTIDSSLRDAKNVATALGVDTSDVKTVSGLIDAVIEKMLPKTDGICKNLLYDAATTKDYTGTNKKIKDIVSIIEKIYIVIDAFSNMTGNSDLKTGKADNDDKLTYFYSNVPDTEFGFKTNNDFSIPDGFPGDNRTKSSFDLGGFAGCTIKQEKIEEMLISKFCLAAGVDANISISPAITAMVNTVNAGGLPSYGGKQSEEDNATKKVKERIYPSGMTGEELFRQGDDTASEPDGGFLLSKAKENPNGSTARAFKTYDKASLVLKELAAATNRSDEANLSLPKTKADAMDMEDEIVGMETRLHANFFEFGNTLTDKLAKEILTETDMRGKDWEPNKPHVISLAGYEAREKEVTKNYFQSDKSGLATVYKGIEDAAKARMSSEMLLMTADPNYISDPSEARMALIKPAQRTAFRYAALIQQEKNKQLKLKYALEIKRKQQMLDIIKRQSYIRASIFRAEAAQHELKHLLQKADASIKIP